MKYMEINSSFFFCKLLRKTHTLNFAPTCMSKNFSASHMYDFFSLKSSSSQ